MTKGRNPLDQFHPLIAEWFSTRYDGPTAIQNLAWPQITAGRHVLITAPTGTGKTLTAFLYGINQLVSGRWPTGEVSVLYVSPMKALNNDIHQNLIVPLQEIEQTFRSAGLEFPEIHVATRSGDTPQNERRKMIKSPPEILITTPESLNIMLSGSRARTILESVRSVILDEIHAVLGSKRGTHLITAVERVAGLAGEFQRIAVSATVRPLERVAAFVGGFRRVGESYEKRDVEVVAAPGDKKLDLKVRFPAGDPETDAGVWPTLIQELHSIIKRNTSTLIFVTTRTHAEKVALLLNEESDEPIAYSHHGSLSRELRSHVEKAMKRGELQAIVATNSLELGIDIGALDEVVMVKTPPSVASTLQRIGRAGHQVSATSKGTLFALYGRDAVDAVAMAAAVADQDIEGALPIANALDVLAQVIVSMTGTEAWNLDELYNEIRCSWPYHSLDRLHFDLVVEMLAGRYADTRIRELNPRVTLDRVEGTIKARVGSLMLLYQSGGTIPDRGYYGLRIGDSGAKVGELDEEFVWERRVGESFMFGSQLWRITAIGDRDVQVVPGAAGTRVMPFWKAEARGRDVHYALRVLEFLETCDGHLERDDLDQWLASRGEVDTTARSVVVEYLTGQRDATRSPLPHRHHILVERYIRDPHQRGRDRDRGSDPLQDAEEVVIHCGWGAAVNQPLSMVIASLWERQYAVPLEVFSDDNCVMLLLPTEFRAEQAFGPDVCRTLLRHGVIEELLRARLEQSGMFGALFRENAGRALLLPRGGFNRRMPLWLNRIRAKKLMSAVSTQDDFPILLETWRECLQDRFDLNALRTLLTEISTGEIEVTKCQTTAPSPFARDVVWQQTNLFMYRDDTPEGGGPSDLAADLIRTVATDPSLRPKIPMELIAKLERRLQRLEDGYAPSGTEELVDWIAERIVVPSQEFERLLTAVSEQHEEATDFAALSRRLCWILGDTGEARLLAAIDALPKTLTLLDAGIDQLAAVSAIDPAEIPARPGMSDEQRSKIASYLETYDEPPPVLVAAEWLRYYGPRPAEWPAATLGLDSARWSSIADDLVELSTVIIGELVDRDHRQMICDTENIEYLLRLMRRDKREAVEPVPPERLIAFWADRMGLAGGGGDPDALVKSLDRLFLYPAQAASWETDLLPSRLSDYHPVWLDGLFKEHGLLWVGCGKERTTFCLRDDLPLIAPPPLPDGEPENAVLSDLQRSGPSAFFDIMERTGSSSESLTEILWSQVWNTAATNDSYETLRKGVANRFAPAAVAKEGVGRESWPGNRSPARGGGRRAARSFRQWNAARPTSGRWLALTRVGNRDDGGDEDPISVAERAKDRARLLLDRYGVVFRELVRREMDSMTWSELFRALRIMELSGEVVGGSFVSGIQGPQFAVASALEPLAHAGDRNNLYWMAATDPASPCGLPIGFSLGDLPSRIPSNHLVFRGTSLVMTSRRYGAEIGFAVRPEDADIVAMFAPLKSMVGRRYAPLPRVAVETVNGVVTRESPYRDALVAAGFRADYRAYSLVARYQ